MRNLAGRVFLVCGAATGIGAATVRRLFAEGASVAVADINLEGARALVDELGGESPRALAAWYDQGDAQSIQQLMATTVGYFGGLDGLLANAADMKTLLEDGDLLNNDAAVWEQTLQVNVTGVAMLFRAAIPHLEGRGGTLLATSSDAASSGEPVRVAYAASKAAINAICRHVANRWGKKGIRCNVVSPGLIMTEQLQAAMDVKITEALLAKTPSPRHGVVEDVASAVAFLFSDDAEWLNGQVWHVNGGINQSN